jgi:drug/metabolite transporter (DMT)-like permease
MLSNVVLGTVVPVVPIVHALRHLSATRVAIAATAEPVAVTTVAWAWPGERLGAAQPVGAAVVLAGIAPAQTAR